MTLKYLALLRGINVGGKNMLPMKELAEMFAMAKCKNVRTFIQSGNVIFEATPMVAAKISKLISAQITRKFGHQIPVIVRTEDELGQVVSNNPFIKMGVAEDWLHVMFLADAPSAQGVASLDPERSPPGEFIVSEREIYLKLPKGVAGTKLTNSYFDAKLGTVSTQRNWRTVKSLLALMQE